MPGAIEIRALAGNEAEPLWHLRLQALESEPSAFGESVEEHLQTSPDKYRPRLRSDYGGNFVLGALDGSSLIGMAGFYCDHNRKEWHKGHIWVSLFPNLIGRQALAACASPAS